MGVRELANTVAKIVEANKRRGAVYQAVVIGGCVRFNGLTIPYTGAVDTPIEDGDYVMVLLDESRTHAVVVGK